MLSNLFVKATLNGTVNMASLTFETGFVMQIKLI